MSALKSLDFLFSKNPRKRSLEENSNCKAQWASPSTCPGLLNRPVPSPLGSLSGYFRPEEFTVWRTHSADWASFSLGAELTGHWALGTGHSASLVEGLVSQELA